jgi:hypothetical protein
MIYILPLILTLQLGVGILALSGQLGPVELWHVLSHLFSIAIVAGLTGFNFGRRF